MRSVDPLQGPHDNSMIAGPSHLGHHNNSVFISPHTLVYQSVKSPHEKKPGMFMSSYTGEKRRKNMDRYSEIFTLGANSIDSSTGDYDAVQKENLVNKFARIDKAIIARQLDSLTVDPTVGDEIRIQRKHTWQPPTLTAKPRARIKFDQNTEHDSLLMATDT
jgi:hypothetical protein